MTEQIELVSRSDCAERYEGKLFSTGNLIIDSEIWHMWEREVMLLHWPSKNWKTSFVVSMANLNWKAWNKVAFFSLEMTKKNLKMQQSIVASWMNRTDFESWNYTEQQRERYTDTYNNFDKKFTIYDDTSLPPWYDWYTLETLISSIKMLHKNWYNHFIIDSLWLIGWSNWKSKNDRQGQIVKDLRKLKNSLPIWIVLIHHNHKWWWTFSWSQDLENFVDWRIEVKKYLDPDADWKNIFHQTKIRVYKERLWKELEFVYNYDRWRLIYESHWYIKED